MRKGQRCRPDEAVNQPILRAGRITQQAVDTVRVLLVDGKLLGTLQVLAGFNRPLLSGNDIGLNARQLLDEVVDRHNQVPLDRKVVQRLDAYLFRVVADERVAGQDRLAVNNHATAATNSHVTGPAVTQCAVEVFLDVINGVEHDPVFLTGNLVGLEMRRGVRLRIVS